MPPILLDGVRPCHREAVGALPPQSVTRRVTAKPQIEELSLSGKPTTRPLSRIRKHAGVRIYSLDRSLFSNGRRRTSGLDLLKF